MILPGISGSFILLLLGSYTTIINAIKEFDVIKIITFAFGCLVGLLSFSKLLKWMFKKYEDITIAVLTGFLLGSLNKLWPWKKIIRTFTNSHGKEIPIEEQNISPLNYEALNGDKSYLTYAIILFVIGFVVIFLLERFGNKTKNEKSV